MGIAKSLTPDQLKSFHDQGFLVMESFSSPEEIEAMRRRMEQLLDDFDCSTASVFSSKNQKQLTDNHFYESAEKVSFFFEEKAFDDDGNLKQPKQLSINKVGHALHELDPVFKKFCQSEKVSSMLASLDYKRPAIIQSMYIFKFITSFYPKVPCPSASRSIELDSNFWDNTEPGLPPSDVWVTHIRQPGIGGEVVPHQDNSFLYTEPQTCTGLWLALEDATVINGCLWAIPGSHKNGLVRRFIRDDEGVHFDNPSPSYDPKDFVFIEVKAGSLVVIHGDLIHQSFENQSSKSRHALSLHVVDTYGCMWAPDNWIRRKVDPEPLYVA